MTIWSFKFVPFKDIETQGRLVQKTSHPWVSVRHRHEEKLKALSAKDITGNKQRVSLWQVL